MKIGIVGLGLIGGSIAKTYRENCGDDITIYAADNNKSVLEYSMLFDTVDAPLTKENIGECDGVIIALYPKATISYLREMAPFISKDAIVMDCGGVKRGICEEAFAIAKEYGFVFVGGHPMAGDEHSGFKYSSEKMFEDAPLVVVVNGEVDIDLTQRIKEFVGPVGFAKISYTDAENHDRMIAYTSQLPHVVSSAFAKSSTAQWQKGYSAGSYKDLTRVANLNPEMWSELFLENRDFLGAEVASLIDELEKFQKAIEKNDRDKLMDLLQEGKEKKISAEKR